MRIACECGKTLELFGLPSEVQADTHPMVLSSARMMGWRIFFGLFFCPTCAAEPPRATQPAAVLSPAEAARQAVEKLERGLDRLVLSGVLEEDDVADMRQSLAALYTFAQAEVERCAV